MSKAALRICAFDLETTSLSADLGVILCAVVKEPGQRLAVFRLDETNPDWQADPRDDRALTEQLARRLEECDIWLAFNGRAFDLPFLRSRLAHWGLRPLAARTLIDPYLIARRKLRVSGNSLAALAAYLRLGHKHSLSPAVWKRAACQADRKALDQIVQHCKADVVLLERLIVYLKSYCAQLNCWGSA
jgi:uncharacterized protein YprB with RNaseH-like and TPR domain